MGATMPMIQVQDKHQITLPKEVVAFLQIKPDTYLEYSITNNGVMIRPAQSKKKKESIFRYAGINRKQRSYANAQEADTFISGLRDDWDK